MKSRFDNRSTLTAMITMAVLAATGASAASAGGFPPILLPGARAIANGTHVSCQVMANAVSCTRVGGLSATLSTTGATRVTKGVTPPQTSGNVMKLPTNGGFIIAGTNGNHIYCHVYVEGGRVLSCALNGGNDPGDRGFDISDRSVVLFRNDAGGIRHDLKTYRQP